MYQSSISSSSRCYCGNKIKNPTLTSTCNTACTGNSGQKCGSGSTGYFTVYSLSKLKFVHVLLKSSSTMLDNKFLKIKGQCFTYIGCYADSLGPNRDLSGLGLTNANEVGGGSVETCLAYCFLKGFLYAGVQYS
jgi:hypothetical protein